MDWTGCDVVECVPGRLGGQPVVKNSRVTAAAVVESYDLGETVEEIAYSFDLDPDDIRKIIGFADEHNPVQHPLKGTFHKRHFSIRTEDSELRDLRTARRSIFWEVPYGLDWMQYR